MDKTWKVQLWVAKRPLYMCHLLSTSWIQLYKKVTNRYFRFYHKRRTWLHMEKHGDFLICGDFNARIGTHSDCIIQDDSKFLPRWGTTKLRNETKRNEMKRNGTKYNETKRNTTKRNEKWRNETKRNEVGRHIIDHLQEELYLCKLFSHRGLWSAILNLF